MELLDGRSGIPHITGEKLGKMNLGAIGSGGYVYKVGDMAAATVVDSNHVTVGTFAGQLPVSGRRVLNDIPETVTVTSGTLNRTRNDLIVARMKETAQGDSTVESCDLVVVQGAATTGTASDPSVQPGDLKLYRLPITGVNLGTPVPLFDVLTPVSELRDSISQMPTIIPGTKSFAAAATAAAQVLFTKSDFISLFGRAFDPDRDCIAVMNGSWHDFGHNVIGVAYNADDGDSIYVFFDTSVPKSKWVRVNYTVFLGD